MCDGHACAQGAFLLRLRAGHHAGRIHQEDDGQVKGIAQIHEMAVLGAGGRRDGAGHDFGLVCDDPHRMTVQPREAGDHHLGVIGLYGKETAPVHHSLDNFHHVIGPAPIGGDDDGEFIVAAVRAVIRRHVRGILIGVGGHVGEIAADLGNGVMIVRGLVIPHA